MPRSQRRAANRKPAADSGCGARYLRLRQAGGAPEVELEPMEETVFRLYLQSLQLRDPTVLWAMLRQPPISATATSSSSVRAELVEALPFDRLRANGAGCHLRRCANGRSVGLGADARRRPPVRGAAGVCTHGPGLNTIYFD